MIHYDCCLPWFTNSGLRLFNHNKTWRPEEKSQPLINWVLTSNRIFCEILLKCVVIKTAAPTNVHARACPWQSQRDKVVPSGIESITNPQHPSVWTVNIQADWLTSALLSDRRTKTPHDKVKQARGNRERRATWSTFHLLLRCSRVRAFSIDKWTSEMASWWARSLTCFMPSFTWVSSSLNSCREAIGEVRGGQWGKQVGRREESANRCRKQPTDKSQQIKTHSTGAEAEAAHIFLLMKSRYSDDEGETLFSIHFFRKTKS